MVPYATRAKENASKRKVSPFKWYYNGIHSARLSTRIVYVQSPAGEVSFEVDCRSEMGTCNNCFMSLLHHICIKVVECMDEFISCSLVVK